MTVVISMLRGVNLGAHNRVKMDALKSLYLSLGLTDPRTFIQSGNVIFRTKSRNLRVISKRIENAVEANFGFRTSALLRTSTELRDVMRRNPFAGRSGIDPKKFLVTFLLKEPEADARERVLRMKIEPEELHIDGREMYMYFPNGLARPKAPMATIEKALGTSGTGRNWNTVAKLLEMAEKLEGVVR